VQFLAQRNIFHTFIHSYRQSRAGKENMEANQIIGRLALLALSAFTATALAQGTAFTYQGRLNAGDKTAQGIYDLRFAICDAAASGNQVGGALTNAAAAVSNGLFAVTLDFGSGIFDGSALWLDIAVRTNGAAGFTPLTPRQALTAVPYAVYAGTAATATAASGVPASGIGARTAGISITGNAATATTVAYAGTAAMAYSAVTATIAGAATNLVGNVADAQLPSKIARLNGTNLFTGSNTFAGVINGNGGGLTNLNAGNITGGTGSFAAGRAAKATSDGAFVWNDNTSGDLVSTNDNSVSMRASGGYRLFTGSSSGVWMAAGDTNWSTISDRNAKKNFAAVDGEEVLNKLANVPVQQWDYNWESDDAVPNLGPMAQDFKAAFYPGRDDKSITTLEYDGVEPAAIQGLNRKLEQKETEVAELKARLERLEQLISQRGGGAQ
jgi:hypothetical protein